MSFATVYKPTPLHSSQYIVEIKESSPPVASRKRKDFTMAKLDNDQTIQQHLMNTKKTKSSFSSASASIRKEVESKLLPDPTKNVKPVVFLQDLIESMHGFRPVVKSALDMNDHFPKVTDERIAAYDVNMTTAARNNDLQAVKELYAAGRSVDCCNRFGESLLHLVCRRGFVELGEFLLEEAKLNIRISDDMGRNPFHDICWNPKVQRKLAVLLLKRDPSLLFIGDKRGHTPFDYARPQDWLQWRVFLFEHRELFEPLQGESMRELFSS